MAAGRRRTTSTVNSIDDRKLRKDRERGDKAERLLNNALLIEAFDELEANIHKKWSETKLHDEEGQKALRYQLQSLKSVKLYLDKIVTHGKQAVYKLENLDE